MHLVAAVPLSVHLFVCSSESVLLECAGSKLLTLIIDREAGEIIRLVASVYLYLCRLTAGRRPFAVHTNKRTLPNVLSPLLRGR